MGSLITHSSLLPTLLSPPSGPHCGPLLFHIIRLDAHSCQCQTWLLTHLTLGACSFGRSQPRHLESCKPRGIRTPGIFPPPNVRRIRSGSIFVSAVVFFRIAEAISAFSAAGKLLGAAALLATSFHASAARRHGHPSSASLAPSTRALPASQRSLRHVSRRTSTDALPSSTESASTQHAGSHGLQSASSKAAHGDSLPLL